MAERCPTCGSAVVVVSGDEGTSHYEPLRYGRAIEALTADLRAAIEALHEYGDHQSWRCAYPPSWYLVDPSAVPEGDCPCGLLSTLARFERGTAQERAG